MDIPIELGGLAVRPGSHLGPPEPPRPLHGDKAAWATTHYRVGDACCFTA